MFVRAGWYVEHWVHVGLCASAALCVFVRKKGWGWRWEGWVCADRWQRFGPLNGFPYRTSTSFEPNPLCHPPPSAARSSSVRRRRHFSIATLARVFLTRLWHVDSNKSLLFYIVKITPNSTTVEVSTKVPVANFPSFHRLIGP